MTRALLKHEAPTISLSLTVNFNFDRTLLFLIGLTVWLSAQVKREAVIFGSIAGDYIEFVRSWLFDDWQETFSLWQSLAKNAV